MNTWKLKSKGVSAEANAILIADRIESEQAALDWDNSPYMEQEMELAL